MYEIIALTFVLPLTLEVNFRQEHLAQGGAVVDIWLHKSQLA